MRTSTRVPGPTTQTQVTLCWPSPAPAASSAWSTTSQCSASRCSECVLIHIHAFSNQDHVSQAASFISSQSSTMSATGTPSMSSSFTPGIQISSCQSAKVKKHSLDLNSSREKHVQHFSEDLHANALQREKLQHQVATQSKKLDTISWIYLSSLSVLQVLWRGNSKG